MSLPLLGYCTNVHAGANWEETRANLERHALGVKQRYSPNEPMGVGLWLSASTARSLRGEPGRLEEFAAWLAESGLRPYTFNGFPYGDFHQTRVKHAVYRPDWTEPARVAYTLDLIEILDALLPPGEVGGISTVPLGWGAPSPTREWLDQSAVNLRSVAARLAQLEAERGRFIHLDIEPEPGCVLQFGADVARYFEDVLLRPSDAKESVIRRFLRVCHDICHAAVMFEDQQQVWDGYRSAGISIGKVQVSSAVAMPLAKLDPSDRAAAVTRLSEFVEERYLHQTVIRSLGADGRHTETFHEDLPIALAAGAPSGADLSRLSTEWRVHFHVPIFLERVGLLETTQPMVLDCLRKLSDETNRNNGERDFDSPHIEAETYAWNVLPPDLREDGELASGIARELLWLRGQLERFGARPRMGGIMDHERPPSFEH